MAINYKTVKDYSGTIDANGVDILAIISCSHITVVGNVKKVNIQNSYKVKILSDIKRLDANGASEIVAQNIEKMIINNCSVNAICINWAKITNSSELYIKKIAKLNIDNSYKDLHLLEK